VTKTGHSTAFSLLFLCFVFTLAAKGDSPDLPNLHIVRPYLLRGGEPTSDGVKVLKEMGVETIVDLRAPTPQALREKAEATSLGIKYENLPMSSRAPTDKQVQRFLDIVNAEERHAKNTQDSKPHCVFVHCAHGSDRTGCMVGIFRVTHDHWTFPQAYAEMRRYYFGPQYKDLVEAVRKRAVQ
jgi:protein tyrosine/serine phosphatase